MGRSEEWASQTTGTSSPARPFATTYETVESRMMFDSHPSRRTARSAACAMMPPVPSDTDQLRALDAARWRIAITVTVAMAVVYVGFILLVAYDKPLLATPIADGLSLGILLGALVIVSAWLLIAIYVRWANRHYDPALATLRRQAGTR
jgi:uncharacterized membrane protein (DUF485 family)